MRLLWVALPFAFLASGQPPRLGIIDLYGLRDVPERKIRAALGLKEGDPLPASKSDVEERIEKISGVVRARLEAVCCEAGKAILFVGIEEKGAPHFDFRIPPAGEVSLPREIVDAYEEYLVLLETAVRIGDSSEDLSQGHALAANSQVRGVQERFLILAEEHEKALRDVVRNSADGRQRAIAAHLLGYAPVKRRVVDDLQYAMQDSDDGVRNNAMRALIAFAELAKRDPEQGLRVSLTWFIEMLNSIIWTDRGKAAGALARLTEDRDPKVLAQLRERALLSLVEMARWKSLGHALPAFLIVGRLAELPETEIESAWSKGERETVIAKALKGKR